MFKRKSKKERKKRVYWRAGVLVTFLLGRVTQREDNHLCLRLVCSLAQHKSISSILYSSCLTVSLMFARASQSKEGSQKQNTALTRS